MSYIVIETCSNTHGKPPYSRVQTYANGSPILFDDSETAAKSAKDSLDQPNNGVVNVILQFIPEEVIFT